MASYPTFFQDFHEILLIVYGFQTIFLVMQVPPLFGCKQACRCQIVGVMRVSQICFFLWLLYSLGKGTKAKFFCQHYSTTTDSLLQNFFFCLSFVVLYIEQKSPQTKPEIIQFSILGQPKDPTFVKKFFFIEYHFVKAKSSKFFNNLYDQKILHRCWNFFRSLKKFSNILTVIENQPKIIASKIFWHEFSNSSVVLARLQSDSGCKHRLGMALIYNALTIHIASTYKQQLLCTFPHCHQYTLCPQLARCLKITEKVSFNITSEASQVYILSGQKLIKNAKKWSILASF